MMNFYAVNGFLGNVNDWKLISPNWTVVEVGSPTKYPEMDQWAANFNKTVIKSDLPNILVGYSLGGRLAMHALLDNPSLWDAAIFISSQTGLSSEKLRQQRIQQDEQWASRFEKEPWDQLLLDWNCQSVFAGDSFPSPRHEADYSRKELADMLRYWTLGKQDDLTPKITQIQKPILWIAGAKDQHYVELSHKMHFAHAASQVWIAPEVGHRVPWGNKKLFNNYTQNFLRGFAP